MGEESVCMKKMRRASRAGTKHTENGEAKNVGDVQQMHNVCMNSGNTQQYPQP